MLNIKKTSFWYVIAAILICLAVVLYLEHLSDKEAASGKDKAVVTSGVETPGKDENVAANDLETAVSNAILNKNKGSYLNGECQGEGHYIMDSTNDGTTATAYVLAMYGEYGFENGNFVTVSGSGAIPSVITFSIAKDGSYLMVNY